MQVVQPKPTRLKPSLSSSFCRPDLARYSPTTCDPGASEVLTHGLDLQTLGDGIAGKKAGGNQDTDGFEVLVQDVMAAIATSPWPRS